MCIYTCENCGETRHLTGTARTMRARGLRLICARCHRRIREDRAEIKRGLNEAV